MRTYAQSYFKMLDNLCIFQAHFAIFATVCFNLLIIYLYLNKKLSELAYYAPPLLLLFRKLEESKTQTIVTTFILTLTSPTAAPAVRFCEAVLPPLSALNRVKLLCSELFQISTT